MFYIFQPLHHLNRISEWVKSKGGQVHLSAETFALSLHLDGRVIRLQPRFSTRISGKLSYTRLFDGKGGFIGWVHDSAILWKESRDKAQFKLTANQLKLRVPAGWNSGKFLAEDYLVKSRTGSFGENMGGPYKASKLQKPLESNDQFYEQFIPGKSIKIWCWNHHVAAAELIEPPYLIGDGIKSVAELAAFRRSSLDKTLSLEGSADILAWQNKTLDAVPTEGEKVWIDFRYATPFDNVTFQDRDQWASCSASIRHQISHAVASLAQYLAQDGKHKLFTVDAVVDDKERVWFLEMNSHPMVHPNIYRHMLPDLCQPYGNG